jgi:hypothetical protein
MIPTNVCDGHEPPRSTSHGRESDLTSAGRTAPKCENDAFCNGLDVTEAAYSIHSSIRRLYEHHMVPAEVCDGHEPPRSTSYGQEIDLTTCRTPTMTHVCVTVWTLPTRRTVFNRRLGGCMSTVGCQPRYLMLMACPAWRCTGARSMKAPDRALTVWASRCE